jgi:HAD superfamily hydrolase (TIGR01509 family)
MLCPFPVIRCGALVFDMDGLMVDSEPLWLEVERSFARARGGDWPDELAHACVGRGIAHTLEKMHETFGFAIDLERDAASVVDHFVSRVGELKLKRGCAEVLEAARASAVPCAVASSSTMHLVEATLARFGLRDRFGAVATGDCVAHPKPAPDVFLEAARRLGAHPIGCVVLEDSLAGAMGARSAGMRVIAVPEREPERFVGVADAVVSDLHEARALLEFCPWQEMAG